MAKNELITVEVAYARPDRQAVLAVKMKPDATVREAIIASEISLRFPEIDLETNRIGIFGKKTTLEATLSDHDRIEIYRPLIADPKAARKKAV